MQQACRCKAVPLAWADRPAGFFIDSAALALQPVGADLCVRPGRTHRSAPTETVGSIAQPEGWASGKMSGETSVPTRWPAPLSWVTTGRQRAISRQTPTQPALLCFWLRWSSLMTTGSGSLADALRHAGGIELPHVVGGQQDVVGIHGGGNGLALQNRQRQRNDTGAVVLWEVVDRADQHGVAPREIVPNTAAGILAHHSRVGLPVEYLGRGQAAQGRIEVDPDEQGVFVVRHTAQGAQRRLL